MAYKAMYKNEIARAAGVSRAVFRVWLKADKQALEAMGRWRQKKAAQDQSKKYSSALTKEMKGIVEAFVAQHPDWEPDEVKLTVKCLD